MYGRSVDMNETDINSVSLSYSLLFIALIPPSNSFHFHFHFNSIRSLLFSFGSTADWIDKTKRCIYLSSVGSGPPRLPDWMSHQQIHHALMNSSGTLCFFIIIHIIVSDIKFTLPSDIILLITPDDNVERHRCVLNDIILFTIPTYTTRLPSLFSLWMQFSHHKHFLVTFNVQQISHCASYAHDPLFIPLVCVNIITWRQSRSRTLCSATSLDEELMWCRVHYKHDIFQT